VDERLQRAGEAAPGVLRSLRDPGELAEAGRQQGDDAVGLPEGARPENERRGIELSMRGTADGGRFTTATLTNKVLILTSARLDGGTGQA